MVSLKNREMKLNIKFSHEMWLYSYAKIENFEGLERTYLLECEETYKNAP